MHTAPLPPVNLEDGSHEDPPQTPPDSDLEGLVPLLSTPAPALLLMALRGGPGPVEEICHRARVAFQVPNGSAYRWLAKMQAKGLVDENMQRPIDRPGAREQRVFSITAAGRRVLELWWTRLNDFYVADLQPDH